MVRGRDNGVVSIQEDVPKLMRLKAAAEAAAKTNPTNTSAAALTQSYQRLRDQMVGYLGQRDEAEEFALLFPDNLVVPPQSRGGGPGAVQLAASTSARLAEHAALLLRQMAGWIGGMIDAATFKERILYSEPGGDSGDA
jgi:hypothetical protein